MKFAFAVVIGLAAIALSATPFRAELVPERATGIWSLGRSCDGSAPVAMVNSRMVLMIEQLDGEPTVAIAKAEWVSDSLVLSFRHGAEDLILPAMDRLQDCEALPGILPLVFAEAVAVFLRLDTVYEACLGEDTSGLRCASAGFELLDITGDRHLSRAEISRAVRAVAFFISHWLATDKRKAAHVSVDDILAAWLVASALGPFVADNIVDSYDFNDDGLLSLAELTLDRTPLGNLERVPADLAAEMAPEALSAFTGTVAGILGLLR